MEKSLHADHRKRMLERFEKNGMVGMSDFEVLEMLLYLAIPRADTNGIAHHLMDEFGSLRGVLDAPVNELRSVGGVGPRSAQTIHFVRELYTRYHADLVRGREGQIRLDSSEKVGAYFIPQFAGVPLERFMVAYCDSRCHVIRCELLSEGTPVRVQVELRKVLSTAIGCHAASVIMAHNHPDGSLRPSREDYALTEHAEVVLTAIGLRLLDHIIVAGDQFASICNLRLRSVIQRR